MTLFSLSRWDQSARPKSITVDGDALVVKYNGGFTKLRRGEIRTVVETQRYFFKEGGLMVSERTEFKARMFGGLVWIPKETTDYEYLKNVVEMWRVKTPSAEA